MTEERPGELAFRPTVGSLLGHCVSQHPDLAFVVLGDERITYAEADQASRELARSLISAGVGKGSRVGLLASSSPKWVVSWLAASRVGAIAVLLNTYLKSRELGALLRHSDVQVLLTVDEHLGHNYLDYLEESAPELGGSGARIRVGSHPYLRSVWVLGETSRPWAGTVDDLLALRHETSDAHLDAVEREVCPADPGVLLYTSGSTAEPKGAMHTQGSIVTQGHRIAGRRDVRRSDVIYTSMPLFWVGGFVYSLGVAMHAGATLVFEDRFDPLSALATLERERCTHVLGFAHVSSAMAEAPESGGFDLSPLRRVGDKRLLSPERQRAQPEFQAQGLGMTETLGPHSLDMEGKALPPEKRGSYGPAVPGFERRIVDPETGIEASPGEWGELLVRGHGVMQGLYKVEREATFLPGGWYPTGDRASIDADGHIYFQGRLGTMIKTSGMNVSPREVELVLESHAGVQMALVHGVAHPERGQDVAALVVRAPESGVSHAGLREHARRELSSYKVPRHLLFVDDLDELPWIGSGKVNRAEITAVLEAQFCPGRGG